MKVVVSVLACVTLVSCGIVSEDHNIEHHERATSYQNIHREHFHAVPTYLKKEHKELLEHPVPLGSSSSKVKIHHGDKHDHGYAFADVQHEIHGHGAGDLSEGLGGEEGHEGRYQVQDEVHGIEEQGLENAAGLGHYGTSLGLDASQYQHEVPEYQHA